MEPEKVSRRVRLHIKPDHVHPGEHPPSTTPVEAYFPTLLEMNDTAKGLKPPTNPMDFRKSNKYSSVSTALCGRPQEERREGTAEKWCQQICSGLRDRNS